MKLRDPDQIQKAAEEMIKEEHNENMTQVVIQINKSCNTIEICNIVNDAMKDGFIWGYEEALKDLGMMQKESQ